MGRGKMMVGWKGGLEEKMWGREEEGPASDKMASRGTGAADLNHQSGLSMQIEKALTGQMRCEW